MEVTIMRTFKIHSRLLVTVLCVLVSFIVPVTALAVDCPCFTAEDVMRYASHPAKFVCFFYNGDQGSTRILVRGPYVAFFNIDSDQEEDYNCSASVTVGEFLEPPKVTLLYEDFGDLTSAQWHACRDLIHSGDVPECDELPFD